MTLIFKLIFPLFIMVFASCYNFKGISLPVNIDTFYVEDFSLLSAEAPPDLNQLFAEGLRKKIREESRLTYSNDDANITFKGTVNKYKISYIAPEEGNTTSLNRLEISVKIEYQNNLNEDDSWTKTYSDFEDYDSTEDFQSIKDGLINVILDDMLERIFNDAFTNW